MDNYPENIRCYDHDDSAERAVESALEDAARGCPELFKQCDRLGLEVTATVEVEADEDGPYAFTTYEVGGYGVSEDEFAVVAAALAKLDREHPHLADEIDAVMP
jgi:hypothetical protein